MAKKKNKLIPDDQPSIEAAMEELEGIVETLESGQTPLVDSMSRYERGMALLKNCHQQLEQAAQRIEIVTGIDREGNAITTAFDGTATASVQAKMSIPVDSDDDEDEEDGIDSASLF